MAYWPDHDTIIRSMNIRSNMSARIGDDPLMGITITAEMMERARDAEIAKVRKPNSAETERAAVLRLLNTSKADTLGVLWVRKQIEAGKHREGE